MKGLLIKDIRLMTGQKNSMLLMMVLSIGLMFMQNDVAFGISYGTLLMGILALQTISYDTFENGMAHLMTLPIRRKTYVFEKYLLIAVMAVSAAVVIGAIGLIFLEGMNAAKIPELLGQIVISLVIVSLMMSVMLPIQLKFGVEKTRIVIALVVGVLFAAITLFSKAQRKTGQTLEGAGSSFRFTDTQIAIALVIGIVVLTIVSILISIHVLENKEF